MLSDEELEQLLNEAETDRVERKESAADGTKICEAICAFANDMPGHGLPGVIFVGIRDNGTCANLPITDQLLLTLSDMRSSGNIMPLPVITVQKRCLKGCELAVILVEPSLFPPVRFKGRAWIRVGPRRAIVSDEEEHRLIERRRSRHLPWDLQPLSPAKLTELDLDLFQRTYLRAAVAVDILEQNHRSVEQQLMSLRFLALDQVTPTVVGLLAIGKSPADFIPGGYVQFLRISGTELADPILDQKTCHGPLNQVLKAVDDIIVANNRVATDITSAPTETRRLDYPIAALQQLVRNGIMHRDYETSNAPLRITWFDDRIEIQNPGGPYGQVTIDNFGRPGITDYRNPNVAEVMRTLGFVQRFGIGIQVARKQLDLNGNPEPEFEIERNQVLVIVRKRK